MNATKLTAQEQERENAKFSFSGATLYGISNSISSEFSSYLKRFIKDWVLLL